MSSPVVKLPVGQPSPASPPSAFSSPSTVSQRNVVSQPNAVSQPGAVSQRNVVSQSSAPEETAAAPRAMLSGTMIGMPSPVFTEKNRPTPSNFQQSEANPTSVEAPAAGAGAGKFKGTLMGIAQPGIAPRDLRESAPSPPRLTPIIGTPTPGLRHQEEHDFRPPTVQTPSVAPSRTSAPPSMGRPLWQNALLVGLGLVAAAALGALAASLGPKPLQVIVTQYKTNQDGHDQLDLMCPDCQDGTILMLGEAHALVRGEKAVLVTGQEIKVGRNELAFTARDKEGNALDTKPVFLPIAYRQRASWAGLHAQAPYAEVIIEAPADSTVNIDGHALTITNNTATHRIDLSNRTLGEATQPEPLVLAIPTSVTVDGKQRNGQATLKNNITPLQLTSVGPVHELGGKPLTIQGRTAANATVFVGETKLLADAQGHFSHTLEAPRPGILLVSSYTEKLVARRVEIMLVTNATTPPGASAQFNELRDGMIVKLDAQVFESRVSEGVTKTLLEVSRGCATGPCVLSAVFPEPRQLQTSERVAVTGQIREGDPLTIRVTQFL